MRARGRGTALTRILASILPAAWVSARTQRQLNWCMGRDGATPNRQINGCTAVIRSGEFTGQTLAWAFNNRGAAYALYKGEFDRAIADYDAALAVSPNDAASLYVRGIAKLKKGDSAGADVDIAASKAISPDIADEYARYGITPDG